MVFGQPDIVVSDLFELYDFVELRFVQQRIRPMPLGRIAKVEHYAELHDVPPEHPRTPLSTSTSNGLFRSADELTSPLIRREAEYGSELQAGVAATALVGSPQGIAPPRLPRIRTCRFPASGSSVHGLV